MKSTGLQEDIHGSGTQRIMEASAFIDSQHILDPLASHSMEVDQTLPCENGFIDGNHTISSFNKS